MIYGGAYSLVGIIPCLLGVVSDVPLSVAGDFGVLVGPCDTEADGVAVRLGAALELGVAPPVTVRVQGEEHPSLPIYNPDAAPWTRGARFAGVITQETTAAYRLDPQTVVLHRGAPDGPALVAGVDFAMDEAWGTFGRIEGGALGEGESVYADYAYDLSRIDSIIATADGVAVIEGTPHIAVPRPPALPDGASRIANVWVPGRAERLTEANLFPIQAQAYPEPEPTSPSVAERLLPKTVAKLVAGETVHVLAWGDSVTDGSFVPDPATQRWQEQFVARLAARFPAARIELSTAGWGGRAMRSFLDEPPGSPYNYEEQILNSGADLIVMEFVNDAYLTPEATDEQYLTRLEEFRAKGIEWCILTPHYVRPDWMGLTAERDCDEDPRAYVAGLRAFCARHDVALADASHRWGHLWREGIPYTTLLLNAINHPDERGMKLFADALMELFPQTP